MITQKDGERFALGVLNVYLKALGVFVLVCVLWVAFMAVLVVSTGNYGDQNAGPPEPPTRKHIANQERLKREAEWKAKHGR